MSLIPVAPVANQWYDMPPVGDPNGDITLYEWATQIPEAIRERFAIFSREFYFPKGTHDWATGRISSIVVDPVDATKLRITCQIWDVGTGAWVSPDWVGDRTTADGPTKKWWTTYSTPHADFPYYPPAYKVAIFKGDVYSDGSNSPVPSDPSIAHSLHIDDNGEAYLVVPNDGVLTLNGKVLTDYDNTWYFKIYRASASKPEQFGYPWHVRWPPKPNDRTYAWGRVCQVVEVEVTDDTWDITVSGETTPLLLSTITAMELENALALLPSVGELEVAVEARAGKFVIIFNSGDVLPTANGATVTEPDNIIGVVRSSVPAGLVGKEIVFESAARWYRTPITETSTRTIRFTSVAVEPSVNEYWAVVDVGAYWRPQMYGGSSVASFPRFYVELTDRVTRSGLEKVWEGNQYWNPLAWLHTLPNNLVKSHDPVTDDPIQYPVPKTTEIVYADESGLGICETEDTLENLTVFPLTWAEKGGSIVTPFNYCANYADLMFTPYIFWTAHGWQVAIEHLAPLFVAPIDYTGLPHLPNFTLATWWKYHKEANTRTVTITSTAGGIATFSATAMPERTPGEGNYESLTCFYTLLNLDGSLSDSGVGTLTATTFTKESGTFALPTTNPPDPETTPGDVGKTLIVAFGWERFYERLVRYLYERQIFTPEQDHDGEDVIPPVEEYPGDYYRKEEPSTGPAEFSERGELFDVAQPFVVNQAYRYVGDFLDAPTGRDGFEDLLFQGLPAPLTTFPRFNKSGTVGSGGDFWLEDPNASFWIGAPGVIHQGTGTAGSTTTTLYDSAAYGMFTTHISDGMGGFITELQERLSRFWAPGDRFIDMVLEVEVTDGVWEKRPIVSMDVTPETNPSVTVSPAFSSTTLNRPYKIREPGYLTARGAIKNTFKGRNLIITHPDGSAEKVKITHSDDVRLYWAQSEGVTALPGDSYKIDELEAGSVVHYTPSAATNDKHGAGFVRPELAVQDTRGQNWLTGYMGVLKNCPTIVRAFGRLRKWDIFDTRVFNEMYTGVNVLRHTPFEFWWTGLSETNVNTGSGVNEPGTNPGPPSVWYDAAYDEALNHPSDGWNSGFNLGNEDTGRPYRYAEAGESHIWTGTQYSVPSAAVSFLTKYMYGTTTGLNTHLAKAVDWYARGQIGQFDAPQGVIGDPNDYGTTGESAQHNEFDSAGTSLQYQKWAKWHETAAGIDGDITTSEALGNLGQPSISQKPISVGMTSQHAASNGVYGWGVSAERLVLRWDVPGGLRYV